MMTIQYLSDLHLEFKDNVEYLQRLPKKVTGDILVVAGDTMYLDDEAMQKSDFIRWASDNYERVLLIPGNHEYYGDHDLRADDSSWEFQLASNVNYYNNRVVTIGNTDIILSTLWSYIPRENRQPIGYFLNDFHKIRYEGRKFTTDDYNFEHAKHLAFLKQAVARSKSRHRIVVTHHVPSRYCSPKKLRVIRDGSLSDAFTVDLTEYIDSAQIYYWIYGHSHVNIGVDIGRTRITSNQLGYVFRKENEWNGFDFSRHITLD